MELSLVIAAMKSSFERLYESLPEISTDDQNSKDVTIIFQGRRFCFSGDLTIVIPEREFISQTNAMTQK